MSFTGFLAVLILATLSIGEFAKVKSVEKTATLDDLDDIDGLTLVKKEPKIKSTKKDALVKEISNLVQDKKSVVPRPPGDVKIKSCISETVLKRYVGNCRILYKGHIKGRIRMKKCKEEFKSCKVNVPYAGKHKLHKPKVDARCRTITKKMKVWVKCDNKHIKRVTIRRHIDCRCKRHFY